MTPNDKDQPRLLRSEATRRMSAGSAGWTSLLLRLREQLPDTDRYGFLQKLNASRKWGPISGFSILRQPHGTNKFRKLGHVFRK